MQDAKRGSAKVGGITPPWGSTKGELEARFGKSRSTHATPAKPSGTGDDFFDLFSMT